MQMKNNSYKKDFILILAASFCYLACSMLVSPIIIGFGKSLGASDVLTGIASGTMSICALICRPIVGNLADKTSKYKLTFFGGTLMLISCIGYVVAPTPLFIAAARAVCGIGFCCCSVCMSTWVSGLLPPDKIGSGIGIFGTMNALGMAIAPALGIFVYQRAGYRAAFVVSVLFAALLVVLIQFVGNKGEPEARKEKAGSERFELIEKTAIPTAIQILLAVLPYCAIQSFLVNYIEDLGLPVSSKLFFPSYAVVLFTLRILFRDSFDKKPFSFFAKVCTLSALLGLACLFFMKNNVLLILAAVFTAGGYGIMNSACMSTAIRLADKRKRGLAVGTFYIGLDVGMASGPIIGGAIYGAINIRWLYPLMALSLPLAYILYLFMRKRFILVSDRK